jgi:hypothetical protein
MAFAMTSLKRLPSGAFSARKGIPKDVRDAYRERFGGGWEARFHADAGTPVGEAKRAMNDWLAEIERRIAALRAVAAGQGLSLTPREVLALAGEWYVWFVGLYEDDPGDPGGWDARLEDLRYELLNFAPTWFHENERPRSRLEMDRGQCCARIHAATDRQVGSDG